MIARHVDRHAGRVQQRDGIARDANAQAVALHFDFGQAGFFDQLGERADGFVAIACGLRFPVLVLGSTRHRQLFVFVTAARPEIASR